MEPTANYRSYEEARELVEPELDRLRTAGYIEVLLYHSDDQKYIGMESNEDGVRGCCRRQLQPTPPTHSMPPRLSLTIFCCGFRRRPRRFCAARSAVLLQPIRPR